MAIMLVPILPMTQLLIKWIASDNDNVATTISESGTTNEKVDTNVEEELNTDKSSIAKDGITDGDNSGSAEPVPVSRDDATDVATQILFNFVQGSKSMIDEWTRQCGTLYNFDI